MPPADVSGLLAVDFFTRGYRVSGHISTRVKTVGDILDDRLLSYVELDNVYISRIINPGEIVAAYPLAQLHKSSLLFAITSSEQRLSKVARSISYFGRQSVPVWLALPTFEIEGKLQTAGLSFDLSMYLAKAPEDFMIVAEGVARVAARPEVTFGGEAFLVNKTRVDLFCWEE